MQKPDFMSEDEWYGELMRKAFGWAESCRQWGLAAEAKGEHVADCHVRNLYQISEVVFALIAEMHRVRRDPLDLPEQEP